MGFEVNEIGSHIQYRGFRVEGEWCTIQGLELKGATCNTGAWVQGEQCAIRARVWGNDVQNGY